MISAFPIKTNKSQKQWFHHVRVYILGFLLEGGQVYVALTREMNHWYFKVYVTDTQHQGNVMQEGQTLTKCCNKRVSNVK